MTSLLNVLCHVDRFTEYLEPWSRSFVPHKTSTANILTKILDFRGFDSSIILLLRGGIFMSIKTWFVLLSQGILVGIILVQGDWAYANPADGLGSPFSSPGLAASVPSCRLAATARGPWRANGSGGRRALAACGPFVVLGFCKVYGIRSAVLLFQEVKSPQMQAPPI